jgi:predicted dehydrogenase
MNDEPRYLVVGSGSIAKRHIQNLKMLYKDSKVVCLSASGRSIKPEDIGADEACSSVKDIEISGVDFAIIASPAPFHLQHAIILLENNIPVLIEKPLTDSIANYKNYYEILINKQNLITIGYNLRYLSSALHMRQLMQKQILGRIYSVLIDVGQYLPHWRPKSDYRHSVSSQKCLGGGVLLELSHEIDYLTWIFGRFDNAFCVLDNTGTLEIDVEDRVNAILISKSGIVAQLNMDFLQQYPNRICKVVGEHGNLIWDIIKNNIVLQTSNCESKILFQDTNFDRNKTYLDQLETFARVAKYGHKPAVGLQEGLYVLEIIEALKLSAETNKFIEIGEVMS